MAAQKVGWKYIDYIENVLKLTIYDKENGIRFCSGENKKHKSCCWCCASNVFVEVLIKDDNQFHIKRYGFQELSMIDDTERVYEGHDVMNDGQHPFPNYKKIINNNPQDDYYLFLKEKITQKDGKFRNELKGKDEWSLMFMVIKYIDEGGLKE